MTAQPIFTGTINGHPVRFFRSPLSGPDFPWVCLDDLLVAAKLSDADARTFRRMVANQQGEGFDPQDRQTIAAESGVVTIMAHYCGQGFVDAMGLHNRN